MNPQRIGAWLKALSSNRAPRTARGGKSTQRTEQSQMGTSSTVAPAHASPPRVPSAPDVASPSTLISPVTPEVVSALAMGAPSTPKVKSTSGYLLFKASDHPARPHSAGVRDGRGDLAAHSSACAQVYAALPERPRYEEQAREINAERRSAAAAEHAAETRAV